MGEFTGEISSAANSKNAKGALYAMLAGLVLGNALPSPSDALYFKLQTGLRNKWKRGEITAQRYWKLNTFYYYSVPMLYWLIIGLIIVNIKGDAEKKIKMTAVLIGGGVVIGTIFKLMQDDKAQLTKEEEEIKHLIEKHPEVVKILNKPEFDSINGQFKNVNANGIKFKNVTGEQLKKKNEESKDKN